MAGRGAYDTTILQEIRRRGRPMFGGSQRGDFQQEQRDEAVRRMNIRRGQRTGQGPSANSTAYTPDQPARGKTSSRSKSGQEGHEGSPRKKGPPGKETTTNVPTPDPRPPDPNDPRSWPWGIPGYTPPGDTAPLNPPPDPRDPSGGGGGGPGDGGPGGGPYLPGGDELPVDPGILQQLLPLLALGGLSSVSGRARMYPGQDAIEQSIQMRPHVGGVPSVRDIIDAEVVPDALALPAPRQRGLPAPSVAAPDVQLSPDQRMLPNIDEILALPPPARALPPPQQAPIDVPLGDEPAVKIKKPKIRKPKIPRPR